MMETFNMAKTKTEITLFGEELTKAIQKTSKKTAKGQRYSYRISDFTDFFKGYFLCRYDLLASQ